MKLKKLKTKFIAQNIIYFKTIDSTQTYAKNTLKEDIKDGTVIIADSQENGIGTHERKWYTGSGKNLAMTFILYPDCNIKKISNFTRLIAEVMIKAIKNLYGYELEIKAPNDIIYKNKKIYLKYESEEARLFWKYNNFKLLNDKIMYLNNN